MELISLRIFGTEDYEGVLEVMAPSDVLVKEFWRQCTIAGFCDMKPD